MADLDDLRNLIEDEAKSLGIPGAAVGVIADGEEHVLTTGVTNVASPAPVTEDTLFQIGSTTKTVTATAVMHLVERGLVVLDRPVRDYLPDLRLADEAAARVVTVRHLLTHTGGFRGDVDDSGSWGEDALARAVATFHDLPQLFAPGTTSSYSNAGMRILGRLVEVVTGEPYAAAITRIVLGPLGMESSFFHPWEAALRPHAVGHITLEDGRPAPGRVWGLSGGSLPEGGLLSSAVDQLKYARFHLSGESPGQAPIGAETRALMQKAQVEGTTPWNAVGMPWLLEDHGDVRLVTHGGNIGNMALSTFVLSPRHGFAVTTLTNAMPGKTLGAKVTEWCLRNLLGVVPEAPPYAPAEVGAERLAEYAGDYDAGLWTFRVTAEGTALRIAWAVRQALLDEGFQAPPDSVLTPVAGPLPDALAPAADPGKAVGRFLRGEGGDVELLLLGGRAARRI
ncbi:serine hydrolase domain-containing protein [Sinosporangium siamense]|uniref:Beta-lactamase-related domain-containing protein n=1 Tax=Sinosporangium siamense TaxID=1367973 RepID=A0A919V455_9ACTN|nr:serine hydrolase domain-containing protein [Sinosporangium siamense]GII91620.1 hypothetical protein Ssi02_18510 [Sinosporangium siamense]